MSKNRLATPTAIRTPTVIKRYQKLLSDDLFVLKMASHQIQCYAYMRLCFG